jgi:Flp pilus assembly protein TadB
MFLYTINHMSSVVRDLICRSHLSKKKNGRATRKKTTRQPEKQSAGQPKQNDRSTRKKKRQGRHKKNNRATRKASGRTTSFFYLVALPVLFFLVVALSFFSPCCFFAGPAGCSDVFFLT